jgi:acetyl esterase/lipase
MDAYFPPPNNGPAPAVVHVHGGSWNHGDKRSGVGLNETSLLTKAGFAVFAVNYRLAPEYRFPAMIEDVKCAIRSIRAHAAEYNIDPNRIAAFGASAGGHLVSLLGTSDVNAGFDVGEYLEYSSRVQAVVDIFGPADLTLQNFNEAQIQSASQVFTADQLVLASPVTYISPDDPPFLILHGDRDMVVPLEQSQVLYNALIASGVPAELVIVQNAGHGFQADTQIQPGYQQILQKILQFLERHLK